MNNLRSNTIEEHEKLKRVPSNVQIMVMITCSYNLILEYNYDRMCFEFHKKSSEEVGHLFFFRFIHSDREETLTTIENFELN